MRKDKRECICFNKEYSVLCHAIDDKRSITCSFKGENYSLIPYRVDLNYVDGSLYLLALEKEKPHICHVFRLCWLRNVIKKDFCEFEFNDETVDKLEYLIYEYDYTGKETINLSEIEIKNLSKRHD